MIKRVIAVAAGARTEAAPEGYQFQQMLIMSRHNLRAPTVFVPSTNSMRF